VACAVKVNTAVPIDHEVAKPRVAREDEAGREAEAKVEAARRCGRRLPASMSDQPIQSAVEIRPSMAGEVKQLSLVDRIVERLHLDDEKSGFVTCN
jgi:hypothetical protein